MSFALANVIAQMSFLIGGFCLGWCVKGMICESNKKKQELEWFARGMIEGTRKKAEIGGEA